jgi:hypothetical protein
MIFIVGVTGGILTTVTFLTLQTFRQNSCAFYLTVMSIVNVGQLFSGLLTRIMISGFNIDWTTSSLFYCKFRSFFLQLCLSTSFSCICLATIDQFLLTCVNHRWQKYCHITVARSLTILVVILWIFHGIPYLMFNEHTLSPISNQITCTIVIESLQNYSTYIYGIFFVGVFPLVITGLFAFLAYRNIRQIVHRTVPSIRQALDKQLTTMILVQSLFNIAFLLPYVIVNSLVFNTSLIKDTVTSVRLYFASNVALLVYYLYFAVRSKLDSMKCTWTYVRLI